MTQAEPQHPTEHDPVRWFDEHYGTAADEILEFLGADDLDLEGKRVADIGAGDGIIDLGLAVKGRPQHLVGYDIRPVDVEALARSARATGVAEALPPNLEFARSEPTTIPAETASFDAVVTWSVFEHVTDPVAMLGEARRILHPSGFLFLQLWPFWLSEHGGHLWMRFPGEPFAHLRRSDEEILRETEGHPGTDPTRSADDEYRSLNRITLDQLQRALLANSLVTTKVELIAPTLHIPPELSHLSLADVAVAGVKLIAVPR